MKPYSLLPVRAAFAVSLGLSMGLTSCSHHGRSSAAAVPSNEPKEKPVHYIEASQQALPEILALSAKVQPDPTKVFRIFPPASGRILELQVKPGDRVRRGQVLAILDSSDIATARSDYFKAKVEADRAARAADREKLLVEHGASAEKDYLDARAQSDTALAELARARQRLDMLNISISATSDRVSLPSPASGVVLDVSAAPGEFSRSLESSNPLVTIADLDTIWVVGDVYEKDVSKVSRGKRVTVTVDSYPGQQWNGTIDSLFGALDPATRTLKLRVALPNHDQRFKPEMFAAIHVNVGAHQAIVVPAAAIIHEGQTTSVFIDNGGKPEQRNVTIGPSVDGKVEVLTGLQVGQRVAAEGAELLTEGTND